MLKYLVAIVILTLGTASWAQLKGPDVPVGARLNVSALRAGEDAKIAVTMDIPEPYHSQSNKPLSKDFEATILTLDESPDLEFGAIEYPKGSIERDATNTRISVYHGQTTIVVPVKVKSTAKAGPVKISGKLRVQICDENTCFPSRHFPFQIDTNIVAAGAAVQTTQAVDFKASATPSVNAESDEIKGVGMALLYAFLAGLLFNVMPCVLPVLPLKAIGFYEVSQHNRAKTILFGLFFSAGVVAVFAVLAGVMFALQHYWGKQISWGEQFSNKWFVIAISAVLVVLGVGLMGFFTVNLPTKIYAFNFKHDTYPGNFNWGVLTAVLSTPCTAPLFPALIAFAIVQPGILGTLIIMMVGVGMAAPYLLLSAFPQLAEKFPRTGPFSEIVKQMMGFLMLGSAAFFAGALVPKEGVQEWLIFATALAASVFLVWRTRQLIPTTRAIAIATLIAVCLSSSTLYAAIPGRELNWVAYTPEKFEELRKTKPVMVKFTAKWCGNCKVLEKTVYKDDIVFDAVEKNGIVPMKLDVDYAGWDLLKTLTSAPGIPFTAVWMPGEDKPRVLTSMHSATTLVDTLTPGKTAVARN